MSKRLELVDFLKGFAIFTIVVKHLLEHYTDGILNKALAFGGAGVHVFILCSGFGLYLSYLHKPLKYDAFLKRRFLKVYLPYILVVIISSLIPFYNTSPDKWNELLSHIFLYRMFNEEYMQSYGVQLWFISTILTFYLFWPFIVGMFQRTSRIKSYAPIILSILISLCWSTIVAVFDKDGLRIWSSFFLQYLWEFVLGMYLAKKYDDNQNYIKLPGYLPLIIGAILGVGVMGYTGMKGGILALYNDYFGLLGYLFLALILYKMLFSNKLFVWINTFSYEWYLIHILIFECVKHAFTGRIEVSAISIALQLSLSFVLSVIIAYGYSIGLKKVHLK